MSLPNGIARPRHGRPPKAANELRNRRVVTFVTAGEFEDLEQIALRSDRSLSFVVHRMIATQLNGTADPRTSPEPGEPTMERHEPGEGE